MKPWEMDADQARGYAAGKRAAASQLDNVTTILLAERAPIEAFALSMLATAWRSEADLTEGFAQKAIDQAAGQDGAELADAVAEDLHLRPGSPLAHLAQRWNEAADKIAATLGLEAASGPDTPPHQVTALEPCPMAGTSGTQSEAQPAPPSGVEGPATPWTTARLAKLADLYPTAMSLGDILAVLNRLPGPPIANQKAVSNQGFRSGLKRLGLPVPSEPAPLPEDVEEARGRIRKGMSARWVAEEYGWPLEFAQRLCTEVRAERAA